MKQFVLILSLWCCFLHHNGFAQYSNWKVNNSTTNYNIADSMSHLFSDSTRSHLNIKINPLQWIWDDARVLFEIPVGKSNSILFRFGYRNSGFTPNDRKLAKTEEFYRDSVDIIHSAKYSAEGYGFGIAFRHYYGKNWFFQPLLLYKSYSFTFSNSRRLDDFPACLDPYDDQKPDRDDFSKQVYSFEFTVGKMVLIKNFIAEVYAGIGLRKKKLIISESNYYGFEYNFNTPGSIYTSIWPTLHLGINIGFNIKH
ncbi:MAG: hypothetical protein JXR53_06745 [Bacteroidales bacterium]|nr:hypothetical protein [Bacteroidales bacterium]